MLSCMRAPICAHTPEIYSEVINECGQQKTCNDDAVSTNSKSFKFNNEINRLFIINYYWKRLMVLVAKYGEV